VVFNNIRVLILRGAIITIRPNLKLGDHPLLAVSNCLINIQYYLAPRSRARKLNSFYVSIFRSLPSQGAPNNRPVLITPLLTLLGALHYLQSALRCCQFQGNSIGKSGRLVMPRIVTVKYFSDSRNVLLNVCWEDCLFDRWAILSFPLPRRTFSCAYLRKFVWLALYHGYVWPPAGLLPGDTPSVVTMVQLGMGHIRKWCLRAMTGNYNCLYVRHHNKSCIVHV
jgi:hypothetical protein